MLLGASSNMNDIDNNGRTPLYVCVSSLSTGLYKEDLKYQVPCIKTLYAEGCDMLNLIDWLRWKGPGIPQELLADDENFFKWYTRSMTSTHSLKNLCRKVIQQRLCQQGNLVKLVSELPVPEKICTYLSRKMFLLPTP